MRSTGVWPLATDRCSTPPCRQWQCTDVPWIPASCVYRGHPQRSRRSWGSCRRTRRPGRTHRRSSCCLQMSAEQCILKINIKQTGREKGTEISGKKKEGVDTYVRGPGSERPVDELPRGGPPHRHGRIPAEKPRARGRDKQALHGNSEQAGRRWEWWRRLSASAGRSAK